LLPEPTSLGDGGGMKEPKVIAAPTQQDDKNKPIIPTSSAIPAKTDRCKPVIWSLNKPIKNE
jgi:hypothetical protein